ncbi:hypothetical protein [Leucobacter sp. wl10]|uniref:hypothetical protein n=1 Tax=Leucobacter sp. wl10 TaxID=2304677 RepID=UPI000E5BD3B9|nr:hypothetical protein [Leucobacter sp. wl10]RGE18820.1 hypothetical protein D1J51_13960 [Leucobacter sp. wl10]
MTDGFERYPERGKKKYPTVQAMIVGILILALGVYASVGSAREGEWLTAAGTVWLALTLGLGGVGIGLMGRPARAPFRFLNAVVMTRAERAPVDSWVHVAPTKALPWPLLLGNVLFTLGMCVGLVFAALQLIGTIPRLNAETTPAALLIAIVACLLFAVVSGALAYLNVARKWRNGRFGARPSGVALGEKTVSIRMPGRDSEITWEYIRTVRPEIIGSHRRPTAAIRLELDPAAGVPGNVQMLAAEGYTVPIDALYSALRWYAAHPGARRELGRTEGERRIEGWRRDALAVEVPQTSGRL